MISIRAPVLKVWDVLADITSLPHWSPGIERCHLLTEHATGVGAVRFIGHGGRNFLKEEVVVWEPPHVMTFRIIETSYPLHTSDIRYTLEMRDGSTVATVHVSYWLKFGVLGRLLDAVVVRRTYRKGTAAMLEGLRDYVESTTATHGQRPLS